MRVLMKSTKFTSIINFGLFVILCCTFGLQSVFAQTGDSTIVKYISLADEGEYRTEYYINALELALQKTVDSHGPYKMVPVDLGGIQQNDALKLLPSGEIDVKVGVTTVARERVFRPIRIPLTKGLIGVRISHVAKSNSNVLDNINNLDDLIEVTIVQGDDWPDTKILSYHDLNLVTSGEYDELFNMVQRGDADAFPRALYEVWDEQKKRDMPQLTVDDHIFLHYPSAMYFFVAKKNIALEDRLTEGFMEAIEDGSFDELFMEEMGARLEKSDLNNRTRIRIENPYLPKETPIDDDRLWHLPFD